LDRQREDGKQKKKKMKERSLTAFENEALVSGETIKKIQKSWENYGGHVKLEPGEVEGKQAREGLCKRKGVRKEKGSVERGNRFKKSEQRQRS